MMQQPDANPGKGWAEGCKNKAHSYEALVGEHESEFNAAKK